MTARPGPTGNMLDDIVVRTGPERLNRSSFLPEVQALRAIAVAGVVIYHLWPAVLPAGYVGVDVFFVISGFLIALHMMAEREATGTFEIVRFYSRRVRRIFPAVFVTIMSSIALGLTFLPETRWAELSRQGMASLLSAQNWILASDSVDYLAEGVAPSPFQHFWSLSIEEQFYLLWPILFLLCASRRSWSSERVRWISLSCVAVLAVLSFVWSVTLTATGSPAAYFVSHARFWELGIGVLVALGVRGPVGEAWRRVMVWTGTVLIVGGMFLVPRVGFPGVYALVPVIGTALVIVVARSGGVVSFRTISDLPGIQWLGDVSYSLYLWHWPLLICAPFVVARGVGDSEVAWLSPFVPGAVLALSLLLAGVTRTCVEIPFQRQFRIGATSRVVLGTASIALVVALVIVQIPRERAQSRVAERAAAAAAMIASPPDNFGAGSVSSQGIETFATGPHVIVPSPDQARVELPDGADGRCKSDMGAETAPRCDFGSPDSERVVALVGDSHMEQYLPAFQEMADQYGLRLITYFHSSCPFSTAQRVTDEVRGGPCLRSNASTLDALLAEDSIDLVVTSNRTAVDFVVAAGVPDPEQGFVEVWSALTSAGLPVVVLADNPLMLPDDATSECVLAHLSDPDPCGRSLVDALPVDHQLAAAAESDVTWIDTTPWLCTRETCPAVIGSVLVYRDEQHLTAAYVRTVMPRMWESLQLAGLPN